MSIGVECWRLLVNAFNDAKNFSEQTNICTNCDDDVWICEVPIDIDGGVKLGEVFGGFAEEFFRHPGIIMVGFCCVGIGDELDEMPTAL